VGSVIRGQAQDEFRGALRLGARPSAPPIRKAILRPPARWVASTPRVGCCEFARPFRRARRADSRAARRARCARPPPPASARSFLPPARGRADFEQLDPQVARMRFAYPSKASFTQPGIRYPPRPRTVSLAAGRGRFRRARGFGLRLVPELFEIVVRAHRGCMICSTISPRSSSTQSPPSSPSTP